MDTCAATNKDGTPCSNPPVSGSKYCHVHRNQWAAREAEQSAPSFWTMYAYALAAIFAEYLLYKVLINLGG